MTPFAGTGLSLLLDAALKGTLVLLAASVLVISMRRGSAATRHLVWQLALLAVLSLPLLKLVTPLHFAVLPDFRSPIVTPAARQAEVVGPVVEKNEIKTEDQVAASPSTSAALDITSSSTTVAANRPSMALRVLFWSALIWMVVAAVLLLRLAFGFVLVRWFALRAYPLYENGWNDLNGELAGLVGLKGPVQLLGSPHIATPMTWGITRAVVMLPSAAEDWTDERRRVVLLHEMAHIRRKDSLAHMFAQVACAVYWFHPLVWKAAARMRAEAERACDDLVLRAGTRASVYADHLLELIRTIGGMRTPAVALPMAQRSTFEGRLLAILEPHLDRTSPRPLVVLGMILVVGLVVLPLAGLTSSSDLNATIADEKQQDDGVPRRRVFLRLPGLDGKTTGQLAGIDAGKNMADVQDVEALAAEISGEIAGQMSDNSAVATAVANAIGNISDMAGGIQHKNSSVSAAAMQALINALNDAEVEVRISSVQALGQIEDERAIAALSNALRNDSDGRVRKMAAWALGNIEDSRAVPALTHALKNDRDLEVRRTAVWALGQIEDSAAVPALSDATRDSDSEVRQMSIWALGQIEDEAAVPALANVLRDSNADVRKQAAWALGQIESSNAVPALSAALRDASTEVRKQAAWALGQIEHRPAPMALQDALKDSDAGVRATAAWALAQIEDPGSAAALRAAMRDQDANVRRAVLRALTQIGDEAGYDAVAEMLKDPDPEVRKAAAAALGGRHGGYADPQPRPQPRPRPMPRPIN